MARAVGRTVLHICTVSEALIYLSPLLEYLAEEGWDVHVACSSGRELTELARSGRVTTHELEIRRSIDPTADLDSFLRLRRLMHRLRPRVVHSHSPKGGFLGMLVASICRIPQRIYQIHGLRYETASGLFRKVLSTVERGSCFMSRNVICVSRSVRELAIADGIVPIEKAILLGDGSVSGVDLNEFRPEPPLELTQPLRTKLGIDRQAICVGYAGRLAGDKGLRDLQTAWRLIQNERPGVHLLLAGEEDSRDQVDLSQLRAAPYVHFLGHLTDLRPFYGLLDAFVMPSYREGLGQVLLEAMSMGVPAVGSRVTGIVDVIRDLENGVLVNPRNPVELAAAVLGILEDVELRRRLSMAARESIASRFERESVLRDVGRFYESL